MIGGFGGDATPARRPTFRGGKQTSGSFRGSPIRRETTRRISLDVQKRREDDIVKFFLSQVSELLSYRRNSTVVPDLIERLKSPKMASFDYTDEYTREWFRSSYNLSKGLKLDRLNISADALMNYLTQVSIDLFNFFFDKNHIA